MRSSSTPPQDEALTQRLETPIVHGSRYVGIQSLRCIAALVVVVMHSMVYAKERLGGTDWDFPSGVTGVDIFFVISGFVMYYSSRKLFSDPQGWKKFASRRLQRIVPLYWLATTIKLLTLIVLPAIVLHARLDPTIVILSYLFLPSQNIDGYIQPLLGVGWTLTFEMFFYVVFTLALFLRVNALRFVTVVMVICSLASILRRNSWPPATIYLDSMTLEFVLGMLVAKMCLTGWKLPPKIALALVPVVLVGLLGPWHLPGPRVFEWGLPAFLLCWCAASAEDLVHNKIPRIVLFLSDASYALYLFHPMIAPGGPIVVKWLQLRSPYLSLVISIVLALVGSTVIYRLVDVPIMEHFRKKSRGRSSVGESGTT